MKWHQIEWYQVYDNVYDLGAALVERGDLYTVADLLRYFEKPWKWTPEWEQYAADREGFVKEAADAVS